VAGLGLLVASDHLTDKDYPALNMGKGDAYMVVGATLYGIGVCRCSAGLWRTLMRRADNALEEFLVRRRPLYEVVGMMGLWGTLINGAQAAGLEHKAWMEASWSGANSESARSLRSP
jgi:solute carrier family 35 protein F1/2